MGHINCGSNQVLSLGVHLVDGGSEDGAESDERNVTAGAVERREEKPVGRWTEDVAVDLLPTVVITDVFILSRSTRE